MIAFFLHRLKRKKKIPILRLVNVQSIHSVISNFVPNVYYKSWHGTPTRAEKITPEKQSKERENNKESLLREQICRLIYCTATSRIADLPAK